MTDQSYPRFCPVAMAASLLEPRWTMLVLCEMWAGSTRFSEIQRGVPGMSPGLLSKRLKEMEANGLVMRQAGSGAHAEYIPSPMADELQPLVRALGEWAHRHVDCEVSLKGLDARMLMWNIRRKIDTLQLPRRRSVIQFILKDTPDGTANYWLVARPGAETDLCLTDPKHDVDLYLVASLRDLTAAWMGHSSFEAEILADRIQLTGHELMARSLTRWLIRSSYADIGETRTEEAAPRTRVSRVC